MKWINRNDDESNYEDRRGMSTGRKVAMGGGIGTIIMLALYLFTGQDFSPLLEVFNGGSTTQTEATVDPSRAKENEDLKVFSLGVFNSANDVWTEIFRREGSEYRKPVFVTFTDYTTSECGGASEQVGPFYCPGDEKVYMDLDFFHKLASQYNAPGELAIAYVTAHEVGHHIQKLLGLTDKMQNYRGRVSETQYNDLSVRLELQADFYAGLWLHYAVNERSRAKSYTLRRPYACLCHLRSSNITSTRVSLWLILSVASVSLSTFAISSAPASLGFSAPLEFHHIRNSIAPGAPSIETNDSKVTDSTL